MHTTNKAIMWQRNAAEREARWREQKGCWNQELYTTNDDLTAARLLQNISMRPTHNESACNGLTLKQASALQSPLYRRVTISKLQVNNKGKFHAHGW